MAGSDIFLYGSRLHAHMDIKEVKTALVDILRKYKHDIYVGLILFAAIELSLFWLVPIMACTGQCTPAWWHGFYQISDSFVYILLWGYVGFFLFWEISKRTGRSYFYLSKEKLVLFFFFFALSLVAIRGYLNIMLYKGLTVAVYLGNKIGFFTYHSGYFILLFASIVAFAPILEYLLSCYIVSRFIKKI
jgi:hypothetical protein